MNMTMDELKGQLVTVSSAFVDEYGPTMLNMTEVEILNIITLFAAGNELEAWGIVVRNKDADGALAEALSVTTEMNQANKANADSIALQKKAMVSLMGGVLTIALALVGL